jgi:hypothetical protein
MTGDVSLETSSSLGSDLTLTQQLVHTAQACLQLMYWEMKGAEEALWCRRAGVDRSVALAREAHVEVEIARATLAQVRRLEVDDVVSCSEREFWLMVTVLSYVSLSDPSHRTNSLTGYFA